MTIATMPMMLTLETKVQLNSLVLFWTSCTKIKQSLKKIKVYISQLTWGLDLLIKIMDANQIFTILGHRSNFVKVSHRQRSIEVRSESTKKQ